MDGFSNSEAERLNCYILKQLCAYKGVEIIEGHLMPDHIHMLVSIPLWPEGYYVSTVGLNEATIKKYIQDQEKYDIMQDKLSVMEELRSNS